MKRVLDPTEYSFDPASKQVYFDLSIRGQISLERVLLITNATRGVLIYQFNDQALGGSLYDGALTLVYDTTAHAVTDSLQIFVELPEPPRDTQIFQVQKVLGDINTTLEEVRDLLIRIAS